MTDQISPFLPAIVDEDGAPLANGYVYLFKTATTTLVALENADGSALNNPFQLDQNGRAPQVFYQGAEPVRAFIVRELNDSVPVYDIDPCPRFSQAGTAAAEISFSPSAENDKTDLQEAVQFNAERITDLIGNTTATLGAGTANDVILTTGREFETIPVGTKLTYFATETNTGAMTVEVDGLTAAPMKTVTGADTPADYIRTGRPTDMIYDGTNWLVDRYPENLLSGSERTRRYADGEQMVTGVATSPASGSGTGSTGTGDLYTFTKAFVNANYKVMPQTITGALSPRMVGVGNRTTTAFDLQNYDQTGAFSGNSVEFVAIGRWY